MHRRSPSVESFKQSVQKDVSLMTCSFSLNFYCNGVKRVTAEEGNSRKWWHY